MTHSYVEPKPEVVELTAILERAVAMVRKLAHTPDISLTAASTLRMLEVNGPSRLSDLAAAQGVSQPAMTQLVTRLEREGYAARGGDASDARVVLVELTQGGLDMLRSRRQARARRMSDLLDALPAADRDQVLGAIPALRLLAGLGQSDPGRSGPPSEGSSW